MRALEEGERFRLVDRVGTDRSQSEFAQGVRDGLTGVPKSLPSRFFYDEAGSRLFEEICDLPEYYPTRTERGILQANADDILRDLPRDVTLVELGSGSASKTRHLIDALLIGREILRFTPIDISRSALETSAQNLLATYRNLEILAVAAEYRDGIATLKKENSGPELILWLGSSIGNLTREEAAAFLKDLRSEMSTDDRLLIGIDLWKPADVLVPAYDDAAGVTARFNLNLLARVNRELGGHFELDAFDHEARYVADKGRIEMHLVSALPQKVRIDALDLEVTFEAGESIHTENSHKYTLEQIDTLARAAGLSIDHQWFDGNRYFSLNTMALSG